MKDLLAWRTGEKVKVWQTYGPPGTGAWFNDPKDAVDFVLTESIWDAEENPDEGGKIVRLPIWKVKLLFWPGMKIEKDHWGIKCILVDRKEWETLEWSGF